MMNVLPKRDLIEELPCKTNFLEKGYSYKDHKKINEEPFVCSHKNLKKDQTDLRQNSLLQLYLDKIRDMARSLSRFRSLRSYATMARQLHLS